MIAPLLTPVTFVVHNLGEVRSVIMKSPRIGNMTNWAGNQSSAPVTVEYPTSREQVAALVSHARRQGRSIKAFGARHSFTSIAMTDGVAVSLDAFDRIDIDRARSRVTVGGGVTLAQLNRALAAADMALPILGDIEQQTVIGAVATATHGTGIDHRSISAGVVEMELIDGIGEFMRCSATENTEIFDVARVGLGALGIVLSATLECVPRFNLHARDTHESVEVVMADFDGFARSATHAEFFWMPGAEIVNARRNDPTDQPTRPQSKPARILDKYLAENAGLWALCSVGRVVPSLGPRLTKLMASLTSKRDLIDRSDRIFTTPRHVKFVEMEYGVPIEHMAELVPRVMKLVISVPSPVLFPIEVRVSGADDIALSTGDGRVNGWIAVHQFKGAPYREFFERVEELFNEYPGARPHWAKTHSLGAADLAPRYPRWNRFQTVRDQIDPDRVFRNDYLTRILGF